MEEHAGDRAGRSLFRQQPAIIDREESDADHTHPHMHTPKQ